MGVMTNAPEVATPYVKAQAGYSQGSLFVTPYFTDSQLAALFVQFQATGVDQDIWYQDPPDLRWFLNWSFDTPGLTTLLGYVQDLDGEMSLAGICWIYPRINMGGGRSKSEFGFGFLPTVNIWNKVKLGRMMLDWAKDNIDVDFVFGFTPTPNESAIAFSRRLGFWQSEPIPNYCTWKGEPVSAIISQLELSNGRKK
jgi:hypothetical protein